MRPPSRGRTPICVSAAVREPLLGRARRARFPAKPEYCCRTDIQAPVGACPSPRARDCDPNSRRNAAADVFSVAISSPLFLSIAAKVRDRRRRNRTQRSTTMCARRKNHGRNHTSSVDWSTRRQARGYETGVVRATNNSSVDNQTDRRPRARTRSWRAVAKVPLE